MAQPKKNIPENKRARIRPAKTPEERENQIISLTMDLVERRIKDGSASSQELVHFLKLGSSRNSAEVEKLRRENELLAARSQQIESTKQTEELYKSALEALKEYKPSDG